MYFIIFCCPFSLLFPLAQQIVIPPDYVFYKGDSLTDFNWMLYLNASELKNLDHEQMLSYLHKVETAYVQKKYNISLPGNHSLKRDSAAKGNGIMLAVAIM